MAFELSGKVIEIYETTQVSDSFKKREFVVEKEDMVGSNVFTDMIKFQLTQDRCNLVDSINIGDEVKVNFNIRGRRWEKDGKVNYFTNLEAWKIEKSGATAGRDFVDQPSESMVADDEPNDDLPF